MINSQEIIDSIKSVINFNKESGIIPIHEPFFKGSNAYKYVKNCLDTGWVSSSGEWVTKFEQSIQSFTKSKYAIVVSNGTVALRLALFLVGVEEDCEVLMPPLSFVATANAVSHLGALPHFVDIDAQSLGLCPKALDKRLNEVADFKDDILINKYTGRKIGAVVPVHVFGLPANINEIKNICEKWKLPLVEDAAEALGSRVKDSKEFKHCGCFGDFGILSFNGNKIITSGGGGALLTNDKELALSAKHLSTTAKVPHPWNFYHDQVGWNDRLPNINAALGCSQMEIIEQNLKNKRLLHTKYTEYFENIKDLEILKEMKNSESNYWLVTMRLNVNNPERIKQNILQEAYDSKIFLRPSWQLLNELPMYKNVSCGDLRESIKQSKRLINLPSSPQLLN